MRTVGLVSRREKNPSTFRRFPWGLGLRRLDRPRWSSDLDHRQSKIGVVPNRGGFPASTICPLSLSLSLCFLPIKEGISDQIYFLWQRSDVFARTFLYWSWEMEFPENGGRKMLKNDRYGDCNYSLTVCWKKNASHRLNPRVHACATRGFSERRRKMSGRFVATAQPDDIRRTIENPRFSRISFASGENRRRRGRITVARRNNKCRADLKRL